jgi:LysM repeat protein
MKSKIWLNVALYFVKPLFVFGGLLMPFAANAGVFSFVSELVSNKQADAGIVTLTSQNMPLLQSHLNPNATNAPEIMIIDGSALASASGVSGTQADLVETKSTQISLYVVRAGDSLSQIAQMFDVSVNTIVWANDIKKGVIREGDELVILPITGVSHTVTKGETIKSIATKYKADMDEIVDYNGFKAGQVLAVGSTVLIPDGEIVAKPTVSSNGKPTSPLRSSGGPLYKDYYMRPISGGRKSQGLHGNNGVDLAASSGTPIYAAADGVAIIARSGGYNGGYGSYVVISHPNGTQTLYAHASKVIVAQGQAVAKGDTIALMGSTGKSTGSHLHFEVRGAANPF